MPGLTGMPGLKSETWGTRLKGNPTAAVDTSEHLLDRLHVQEEPLVRVED
jgi:hypothetical protein